MQDQLKTILTDLKNESIEALTTSLQKLTSFNKSQFTGNMTISQKYIKQILPQLRRVIGTVRSNITPQMMIPQLLQAFAKNLPKQISNKVATQLGRVIKQSKGATVQAMADQIRGKQKAAIENQLFKDAIEDDDVANIDFTQVTLANQNQNAIQSSIQPFKALISPSTFSYTNPESLPRTMMYLAQYTAQQKKIPVSPISSSSGLAFVGVQKVQASNGTSVLIPYEKNQILKSQFPNLGMQFRYHANKTINSWNKYVQSESKLVDFVNQISTEQSRSQYVQRQFRNMNLQTFSAQTLATLAYYYIYIPMQVYITNQNMQQNTEQDFYQNYEMGDGLAKNPLMLSKKQGVSIAKLLLNHGKKQKMFEYPTQLLVKILKGLKSIMSPINKTQILKIVQYQQKKTLSAQAFFDASGIKSTVYSTLLGVKNFSSVKVKPFLLSTGLQNSQYNSLVRKIANEEKLQKRQRWDTKWGDQRLYCHDYVWGRQ